ncbi:MAG: nucleoside diphosphate kinase regulator [Proteobacteria bacterium]|nr:nucleoside diphosphate kinase regulator [Pseudomonadota bacterium]
MSRSTQEQAALRNHPILISRPELSRLKGLLHPRAGREHDRQHLRELQAELDRAVVLEAAQMPADVITIGARVGVRDVTSGELQVMTLVFPQQADVGSQRISVLAPMGTALLGYREGDEVEWIMPGGPKRLDIEWVRQPAGGACV